MRNIQITALQPTDRQAWEALARGYKDFYKTPTTDGEYETAWQRLLGGEHVFGLGAKLEGQLVGITHFLFHTSAWAPEVCYLQDLFTVPAARGKGVARALIKAVGEVARKRGAKRCYWLTQEHNKAARFLYDKIAKYNGFIRYDLPLDEPAP